MEDPEPERVPFDEREALEELERFRQDIERYRSQRKALGEEFEQFIRSFQKPAEMPVPEPPRPAPAFEKPREPAVAPAATLPPKPPTPGPVTPAASAGTPAASSPLTPRVVTAPTPAF